MLLSSVARTARAPVPVASCSRTRLAPPESRFKARAARRFSLSYVLWLLSEREEVPLPLRTSVPTPLPLSLLYRTGAALSGGAWAQANATLQGTWRGPFLLPTVPLPRPNGSDGPTRAQGGCVLQPQNGSYGPARPARVAGARAEACGPSRSPGAEALEKTEGKDAREQTWGLQPLPSFDVRLLQHLLATRAPAHARPARLAAPRCAMTRAGGGGPGCRRAAWA